VAFDLVIDIENSPGALAEIAVAISDAGVNIAAATCVGSGERAELHILVPYAEAAKRLRGETVEVSLPAERPSFFGKLFGRRAVA